MIPLVSMLSSSQSIEMSSYIKESSIHHHLHLVLHINILFIIFSHLNYLIIIFLLFIVIYFNQNHNHPHHHPHPHPLHHHQHHLLLILHLNHLFVICTIVFFVGWLLLFHFIYVLTDGLPLSLSYDDPVNPAL